MKTMWRALEEHTHVWHALDREGLADAVWSDYVSARFSRSGDARALAFLYPYVNRGDRNVRLHAIRLAATVFEGAGPSSIGDLHYFTGNLDPFVRDRAVQVVGAALTGWPVPTVLDNLQAYLEHRNRFIRAQAMTALSYASFATGSEEALEQVDRIAGDLGLGAQPHNLAVARIFAGRPTRAIFERLTNPEAAARWRGEDMAVGILIEGAEQAWYERACERFFDVRLAAEPGDVDWRWNEFLRVWPQFLRRSALEGLCRAGRGRGFDSLQRILHRRDNACVRRAMEANAPQCFAGAEIPANRAPLLQLLTDGDATAQRIAAICLGTLMEGTEDDEAVKLLTGCTEARDKSVAAAAVAALGRVLRSSCDEAAHERAMAMSEHPETARAAIEGIGWLHLGSGQREVLSNLRDRATAFRNRTRRGRAHFGPLRECFLAVGRLYHGTGSMEPVDFLLDALSLSRSRYCVYRGAAGRALVMIEFPPATIERTIERPWR